MSLSIEDQAWIIKRLDKDHPENYEAKCKLMEGIMPFIVSHVNKQYPTYKSEHLDGFIASCAQHIISNLPKFDANKNIKLTTYVFRDIKKGCYQYLINDIMHVSEYQARVNKKIMAAKEKLIKEGIPENEITYEVLALETGLSVKTIASVAAALNSGSPSFIEDDFDVSDNNKTPEEEYMGTEVKEILLQAMSKLTKDERYVLEAHAMQEVPYKVIANAMGMDEKDVKTLYNKAIKKMRNNQAIASIGQSRQQALSDKERNKGEVSFTPDSEVANINVTFNIENINVAG